MEAAVDSSSPSEREEAIVVVGAGVVGTATALGFREHGHSVSLVDVDACRVESLRKQGLEVSTTLSLDERPAYVFVTVQTPADREGGYDLSALRRAVTEIGTALRASGEHHTVVVRSTVPPGTTDQLVQPILEQCSGLRAGERFGVAVAPEFLRARSALDDFLAPAITVLASRSQRTNERLTRLFQPFEGNLTVLDNPVAAELIKLAHNSFNATKISFWNEIWRLSKMVHVDADDIADAVAVSSEASRRPEYGIRGGRPYDGSCLPKDLDGLLAYAASIGLELPLLRGVREANDTVAHSTGLTAPAQPVRD